MSAIDFLKHVNAAVKSQMASVIELPAFLETADRLSLEELKTITRQALALLELTYVHLPFKRAMHAVDPIQRLKLLLYRLENTPENQLPDEIEFHHEMTEIFTSLRDLHTNYLLPAPYNNKTAFLPFYIEEYFEEGKPKYIVSKVMEGFCHPTFKPGVEVRYWNGIPIARAIWLNGQRQAGGNQEARYARGLDSLTVRPMNRVLPPDEEWVCVEYRSPDGKDHEIKHKWLVFSPGSGRTAINPNSITAEATALGLDIQTDAVQEAKKVLFAPGSIAAEKEVDRTGKKQAVAGDEIGTIMPGVFRARTINAGELSFGYVRIFTFNVNNADQFVCEFIRLVGQLPQNGLIIDVRGNGGGLIYAGEQLLQVITPHHIEPESFQFINTPLTYQLCQAHSPSQTLGGFDLTPWTRSTGMAVETGSTYSQGYPVTDPNVCNAVGQKYYGPVVLITNALCYSTTDIFAAGFQDLDIGKIIATSGNTGAGGANVWTSQLLQMLLN
ncbi:MAG TPA: S41 family peptidase, partial [Candidatus Deferrimicrobium sp.]|nr:S41 family peptidase [Candidatus Deferrimicrobium sp.]